MTFLTLFPKAHESPANNCLLKLLGSLHLWVPSTHSGYKQ